MFYSHEVLTSRKYGVATVWLVATLGSKSSLKRINRKQILDVDVVKACQTIVDPVAPMALRLQGNLLYGVSRVYLQQCGYVLSDAQNAHNAMLVMLRTVKNHALDPDAGKTRPEQLILQDDPCFLPEFALPPPELFSELGLGLNIDITLSGDSQSLAPFGSQQTQSSPQAGALGGLVLPSSSPIQPRGFSLGGDHEAAVQNGFISASDGFELEEPEFTFDENGELVEGPSTAKVVATSAIRSGVAMHNDADASAKVKKDHEEGRLGDAQIPGHLMNLDLPMLGSDLPDGEAFPSARHDQGRNQIEVVQSSSTASAPMRKKRRTARILPTDSRMELRNKDLADWNANYLQNMNAVVKVKKQARVAYQAKKDAEYFVWGSGIGGFAHHYANITGPNPFELFIGDNLFELATGFNRKKYAGRKHDRDSGIDDETQNESRRIRQKTSEPAEEQGRGHEIEDYSIFLGGDEIELPRDAATALDDQQVFSSMPWNISASKHGSSAIPRSGRLGSMDQGRHGSRLVSASPLHGRGQPLGLEALNLESEGDIVVGGEDYAMPGSSSPPAVGRPLRRLSARVTKALSAEGENFLDFVTEAIVEKRRRAQNNFASMVGAEGTTNINGITFQELLPFTENNKMIACQGLMMVLTLGTKGILDVQQREHFGDIGLKITEKVETVQVVEISDGDESESEEEDEFDGDVEMMEQDHEEAREPLEGEGLHFEEQFAAGHAAHEDDHGSLYDD